MYALVFERVKPEPKIHKKHQVNQIFYNFIPAIRHKISDGANLLNFHI